jgi:tetratricopeptide (TPR) repeat protein
MESNSPRRDSNWNGVCCTLVAVENWLGLETWYGDTSMDANLVPKTIRRLQTAEGYLELNLPARALAELNAIEDQGPFEAAIALLRGEALKIQARYSEALVPLKRAATLIPSPLNKRAWRSLSECYRQSGRQELAEVADLVVNAEEAPAETQPVVRVAIVPLPMLAEALQELFSEMSRQSNDSGANDSAEDETGDLRSN